jgi:thymidylate synthase
MKQYHDLAKHILENGTDKGDRTGTGTRSVFGYQMRFDLQQGFPLVTTKFTPFKSLLGELIWFLKGCKGGIKELREKYGCTVWDEWEDLEKQGKVVPYGNMWRKWKINTCDFLQGKEIDQLSDLIQELQNNPNSRRLILETWNVGMIKAFVLPPCHKTAQFYVANGKLSCMLDLRSSDFFLGLPYNIAQYALFTHILANVCDYGVGDLIVNLGDSHIYSNHFEQVQTMLSRDFRELPTLTLNRKLGSDISAIDSLELSDFTLTNYNPHAKISAPVAV